MALTKKQHGTLEQFRILAATEKALQKEIDTLTRKNWKAKDTIDLMEEVIGNKQGELEEVWEAQSQVVDDLRDAIIAHIKTEFGVEFSGGYVEGY